MQILILLMFISLMFFAAAALGFAFSVKNQEAEHAERLARMPFEKENT